MNNEPSSDVYVAIREPLDVRKRLLESSRDIITSLQKFKRLEELRAERHSEIAVLRSDVRELNRLLSNLRTHMPKTKLKSEAMKEILKAKRPAVKEEPVVSQTEKQKVVPKHLSEVEKLEKELDEIESKLNGLG